MKEEIIIHSYQQVIQSYLHFTEQHRKRTELTVSENSHTKPDEVLENESPMWAQS